MAGHRAVIDRAAFPQLSAYLDALPAGLESYPECRAHRSLLEGLVRDHGHVGRRSGLPPEVQRLLSESRGETWMPEVHFQAVNLAIRDAAFHDDAGFADWSVAWSAELLDKPILKHLMRLMSPTLVVTGAAKRWKAIHVGSTLAARLVDAEGARARSLARLTFPERMFPELFLRVLVGVFQVAVSGARGKDTRVELLELGDAFADYETSWTS
jgi:hypothetical protein